MPVLIQLHDCSKARKSRLLGLQSTLVLLFLAVAIAGFAAGADNGSDEVEARAWDHIDQAMRDGLEVNDFHHLLLAFEFRAAFSDWTVCEHLLDRLAGAASKHPLMAAELQLQRARVAVDEGHPAAARELFATMGGLTRWWVRGPKGLEELADFSPRAVKPGNETGWRFVPGTNPLGWLRLEGLGWPARRQMLYLATTVVSDREQAVAVRVGAAQVARLWLNGEHLLTTDYPLQAAEDQVAASGWLGKGANTLVVAVASETADWWLRVRLTAPDGSALPGISEANTPPTQTPAIDRKRAPVVSLEGELKAAVERKKNGARLALAALMVDRSPEPQRSGAAREACRSARTEDPVTARILEWLVTTEPTAVRDLLEEAVARGAPAFPARTELARWYSNRGLYDQAHALLADALHIPAVSAVALDLDSERWGPAVMPEVSALAERHPRCLDTVGLLAQWALEFGRWPLAHAALEDMLVLAPERAETQDFATQVAADCGDGLKLRTLLGARLENEPNSNNLRIRLARLEAAEGDDASAEALLAEGLHRCPGHVDLLMESAFLEHRLGRDEEAVTIARRVLHERPQSRRAEHLLALLGVTEETESWGLESDALWDLVDEADHLAGPYVALLDHRSIRFLPGNLTEEQVQHAFYVSDAQRSGALKTRYIAHVPESQRLRVASARILRRDGSEVSARSSDTPRLSEPEFNLYYDTRLRVLQFDGLQDGDLIDIAYLLTETAEANDTGAYKGGLLRLGHAVPSKRTVVELVGLEEQLPAWEWALVSGEPERTIDADGTVSLRWVFNDLPANPSDVPPGPNLLTQPHLAYSNHPEWSDLADWYGRHVATRIRPSRRVEEVAETLIKGTTDRSERISLIYGFVTTEIRYVGLEFGEHRFRPFSADWVLDHKMGDCKDTAGLLVALFTSIGIPANMVMVRTSDLGPVTADMALLEDFNHAIAYLPEDDLWLDGTAAGHDAYPPPGIDQNAWVMVVNGANATPITTPAPGSGKYSFHFTLSRGEKNRYDLMIRTDDTGEAATHRRGRFGGSRSRVLFARWLQDQFPGAELVGEPKLALAPGRGKATMEVRGVIDRSALHAGGGLRLFPGSFDLDQELTPTAIRSTPLLVPVRPDIEWTLEIENGQNPELLPEDIEMVEPHGELVVTSVASEGGVRVEGRFHLRPGLVSPDDAEGFRSFLVAARRAMEKTLEVP